MAIKPKLCMIPSGVGTDTLYSVLPTDGTGDFTFDRNLNTATRVNKDGLIEMVDADVPRLNYPLIDGVVSGCPSLLLEPASTNLIQYSEDFNDAYYNSGALTVSSNASISPDGTLNADKITEDATSAYHYKRKLFTVSGEFTISIFVKKAERDKIWLGNVSTVEYSIFDLTNESSTNAGTTSSKIENYGNGWYRCTVVDTLNQSAFLSFGLVDDNNNINYQGDGTSGLYAWGFQYEANSSYPTSYIPTSGSIATRSAETCNNAGDVNTFNDSEGVLFWDGYIPNDGNEKILQISDGNNTNVVRVFARANGDDVRFQITNGGINSLSQEIPISSNNYYKISLKYKENDISVWVNGFELYDVNNGSMPSNLNTLEFNSDGDANPFYGNTKQLQYFDTALTDTDLEELTSWSSFNEMANSQLYSVY